MREVDNGQARTLARMAVRYIPVHHHCCKFMANRMSEQTPAQRLKNFVAGKPVITGQKTWRYDGTYWHGTSTTGIDVILTDQRFQGWLHRHLMIGELSGLTFDKNGRRRLSILKKESEK